MSRCLAGVRWPALALLLVPWCAAADGIAPGGLRGVWLTRSADTAGRGALRAGLYSSWHALDDTVSGHHVVVLTPLQIGFGVADELELGFELPVRGLFTTGEVADLVEPSSQLGFGDLVASGKLALPLPWRRLRLGALGSASLPTGSRSRGMSSESTDLEVGGAVTLDLTALESFVPARLHFNLTYRWNRNETRGVGLAPWDQITAGGFWPPAYPPSGTDPEANDHLLYRVGLEFETRRMVLGSEFAYDDSPGIDGAEALDHPVRLAESATVKLAAGLDVTGVVEISLQDEDFPAVFPRLPPWRLSLGVVYRSTLGMGDGDRDGVPDKRDACPDRVEDFDGFEDEDGCPDLDNDFDGVPDDRDLAPDLDEDRDGFEDEDGRPDLDNDGDGIRDADDACPNRAEDYDGIADADGCPET
jgi:hypothetical protein